ncbi:outer membrane protein assembly factor BamA [Agarilytica rhodophyticola]|uniref:outer membrane protein assembly factor BamA n=1 Tax=Agarilytica rhodophyticola TaxID=1737490 RepID=UPI000B348457|nr:outer membrane protein assembly factor BamA [Agarilytica rhodophyticola]
MIRLFVVLVMAFAATHVQAVSFRVSDIRLEGLQRVSASPVFAAMPVRVGDTVDDEDVRGIIRSLFATGFFANVQIARDDGVLIIILQERPAIKSIEIDGNKAIKTEQLTEIMTDNGLAEGEILQRQVLQGIARELERQYIAQARYGATVDVEVNELPNSLVSIDIQVDEGSAAKIRHINFIGNELYSDEELLDLFELRSTKWYKFFSSADKYAKEKLTGDIENLESFYLDRGYLDFKVVSSQISISPDKKGVFITLNLSEGSKYTVKDVDLAGDPIIAENTVRRLFLLREGDTFSQARMTGTSEYITTLLGNAGYTNASVEGIPKKDEAEKTVDITFFVDPGKRVYVRRIEFSGNTKTADDVLRREMRQLEGSSASNARIENSKVRLERIGYFKEVTVETEDVPGHSDLVDVKYKVEEQPSGSVQGSVGYSEAFDVTLGASVRENNWLGTGKQVEFSINHNRFQDVYSFSYNDPYFTPDGVSRGFSVFYRSSDFTSANFGSSFSSDSAGATVNFGYPISEISFLRFGLGLTTQELKIGPGVASQIRQSPFFIDGVDLAYITQSDFEANSTAFNNLRTTPEFVLDTNAVTQSVLPPAEEPGFIDKFGNQFNSAIATLTWRRNTLNRGILATRGNSQTINFEATIPGSDLEYFKLTYDAQLFVPLSKQFTLRFRTKLGYGDGYGKQDELPFFENFRTGGIGSVRGFEPFTLGPLDRPAEQYLTSFAGAQDLNGDGINDELLGPVYVLCEDPGAAGQFANCTPGQLTVVQSQVSNRRIRSAGGDSIIEFSTELLLPIPFAEDTRSMQLVAFFDAGNVFTSNCREEQINCFDFDPSELRTSYGLGFKWLSGFGPMTFSLAKPLQEREFDDTKRFQFSFGAGF